uniref:L1 transposable element RRM domain-containing protein n=1 Tax=Astatotilapia calliptera TaxID=8154 RepID=A0AAX7T8R9_ASTCA
MPKKLNKDKQKTTFEAQDESGVEEGQMDAMHEHEQEKQPANSDMPSTLDLLNAIRLFKQEFHTEMGGIMSAIGAVQVDIQKCGGRIDEAEKRISNAEDEITLLKNDMESLERQAKFLSKKVEDLEGRSRRNNIRILGIPEKEEGTDPRSFMEKFISDTLKIPPPVLERAHRINTRQSSIANRSRAFIIKCLSYRDREGIMKAARTIKELSYKDNKIAFLPDLPAETYRQQRQYDGVRKKLREIGLWKHRIIYPARLLLTNEERTQVFDTPADVDVYIKSLKQAQNA